MDDPTDDALRPFSRLVGRLLLLLNESLSSKEAACAMIILALVAVTRTAWRLLDVVTLLLCDWSCE